LRHDCFLLDGEGVYGRIERRYVLLRRQSQQGGRGDIDPVRLSAHESGDIRASDLDGLLRLYELRPGCCKLRFRARCVRTRPQFCVHQGVYGPRRRLRASHARLRGLRCLSRRDQGASLRRYLLPSILIALGVVTLFVTGATAHQGTYLAVVAAFLGFGALAIIDALARHPRPWWILIAAAIVTAVVLLWPQSPIEALDFHIFRDLLPGRPQENAPPSLELFVAYFFGAGCAEESLKAIPVLLALGLVLLRRGKFGPLDGLVIGAASGLGFTLVETLGQYVPQAMAHVEAEEGPLAGAFAGVELEIPRLVGALTGHMAWAGYLGYAIGAAAATTNATRRMQLVLGGFAIAAALHALWDTVDLNAGAVSQFIATTIGVASFLLLASAAARGRFAAAPAPAPEAPK